MPAEGFTEIPLTSGDHSVHTQLGKNPCLSRKYSDTFRAIAAFIAALLERDLQLRMNRIKRNEDSEKWCHGWGSQGDSPLSWGGSESGAMSMRWKKILIIALLVIVALIVAAYLALVLYDFNKLKPTIAREVRRATGRELRLDGDINVRLGRTLEVSVDDVGFQNAPWGKESEVISVQRFEAQVALLPLIRGVIEIKRLILRKPDIAIEIDDSGRSNLKFEIEEKPTLPPLVVHQVRIEDGLLRYRNGQSGRTAAVGLDRLIMSALTFESPIELDAKGAFEGRPFEVEGTLGPLTALMDPKETWSIKLQARVQATTATVEGSIRDVMNARGLTLNIRAAGRSVGDLAGLGGVSDLPDFGPLRLSARVFDAAGPIAVDEVDIQAGAADVAEVKVTGSIQDVLARRGVDLRFSVRGKDLTNLERFTKRPLPVRGPFALSGRVTVPETRAYRAEQLKLVLGENEIRGWMEVNPPGAELRVTAELSSEHLDLQSILTQQAAKRAGVTTWPLLGPLRLSGEIVDSAEGLAVQKFNLEVGIKKVAEVMAIGSIQNVLALRGIDINVQIQGEDLAHFEVFTGRPLPVRGPYRVTGTVVDSAAKLYRVDDLTAVLGKTELRGAVDLDLSEERSRIAAELASEKLNLLSILTPETAKRARVLSLPDLGPLTLAVQVVPSRDSLLLEKVDLQVGTEELAKMRVTGRVLDLLAPRGIDLSFSVQGEDVAKLETLTGTDLPIQGAFAVSGRATDPEVRVIRIGDLRTILGKNDVGGSVEVSFSEKPIGVAAELSSEKLDLPSVLSPEVIERAGMGDLPDLGPFRLALQAAISPEAVAAEAIDFQVGTEELAELKVKGVIQDVRAQRGIDLDFSVRGQDLRRLEKVTGEQLPVEGPFSVTGTLTKPDAKVYQFSDLRMVLGENDLNGRLDVHLAGHRPRIVADLSSRRFDIRPLLAETDDESPEDSREQKDKAFPEDPLSLDALRIADANVKLRFGQVLLPRLALDDLAAGMMLEDGQLTVDPFLCVIGGGSVNGRLDLRTRDKEVEFTVVLEIDQARLDRMLDELDLDRIMEGTVDARIELDGRGESVAELMAGLNGSLVSVVREGRLNNTSLDRFGGGLVKQTVNLINPLSKRETYSQLNCAVNLLDIKDGVARSKVLILDTKHTTVAGGGTINLQTEKLNLTFGLTPKGGSGLPNLVRIRLSLGKLAKSFKLVGTLTQPALVIDPKGTTVTLGKAAGGMALLGPIGLAAALIDVQVGKENPCQKALEAAQRGVTISQPDRPVE
jgi:uncharacterized protein involved in outer membrane biogenesis